MMQREGSAAPGAQDPCAQEAGDGLGAWRLPDELAELERLLKVGDAVMIAQAAHRIKGNCSNVSAAGLRRASLP